MTRKSKRQETRTIQLWPGGQSVEFRGDPDGPENQRSLRKGHYHTHIRCPKNCEWFYRMRSDEGRVDCATCENSGYVVNPEKNPWRKGTPDEWRRVRIEIRAELYGAREIFGCDSALVEDLLKVEARVPHGIEGISDLGSAFSYDEIRNLYKNPSDWTAEQCRDYASDNGIDLPAVPTSRCNACDGDGTIGDPPISCGVCNGKGEIPDHADHWEDDDSKYGWLTEAREACREHAQDNPQEPYEWWRVSSWLCDQLHAIGEVTIDNGYGHWWGRTCTGQGWIMDGTLQQVAALFEDRS